MGDSVACKWGNQYEVVDDWTTGFLTTFPRSVAGIQRSHSAAGMHGVAWQVSHRSPARRSCKVPVWPFPISLGLLCGPLKSDLPHTLMGQPDKSASSEVDKTGPYDLQIQRQRQFTVTGYRPPERIREGIKADIFRPRHDTKSSDWLIHRFVIRMPENKVWIFHSRKRVFLN